MNDAYIVTVYTVIDDTLRTMNYQNDSRSSMSAAEILLVAVVSAKYFQNHHERALGILYRLGYIHRFSVSRFNRRLHALVDWLWELSYIVGELFSQATVFIIDTTPVLACKWTRRKRCRKVNGAAYEGYCAAKDEHFCGWQLHLVCDTDGVPVAFELNPARWDELVPVQHLLADLPAGSQVVADKGYISYKDELLTYVHGNVRLIPKYRSNMRGNSAEDAQLIAQHRHMIETVNSQLEKMGLQHLHTRTAAGTALKVLASLVALTFTNYII
jgi:hypothetical protein